jgi:hypothetical protein
MADAIPTWLIQQYTSNVDHKLQAVGSQLSDAVTQSSYNGKQAAVVNYIGETEPVQSNERYGDTPNMEIAHERRWVRPQKWHWGKLVETDDELYTGIAPQGAYVEAAVKGFNRIKDLVILRSFFATAYTGEVGETSESWADDTAGDGQNVVSVNTGGANTGLNVAKLAEAIKLLGNFHVDTDMEEIHMAITWEEWQDLITIANLQSRDYVDGRPISTGKVPELFNINFHRFAESTFERVTDLAESANVRTCPLWAKSGVHLGMWKERSTNIGRRPDKQFKPQIYIDHFYGATRLQPGKIIKVKTQHA